jgi:spermidine/putrescine transport system ATP-binding protein
MVRIDGQDVTDIPAYKRDVNTVFQSYGLFPHLSVYDNVAFGLRRRKVAGKEVERRVNEALELVNLAGYGKRRRSQLSGGQQQRVALARALVNRPQVLLLDEPLGALDLKLRKQMQLELKRIQKEVGITFVFVTHDQEEAMTISDRIAVMNKGHIEQLGRPEEVYEHPATLFVAEFLGASNLLDGTYRGSQNGWGLVELSSGTSVRIPDGGDRRAGDRLRIGVRPEKIQIIPAATEAAGNDNTVAATLRTAVFAGVSFQYFFETREGREMSAFDRNGSGAAVARPGEAVRLAWAPEHTFVIPFEDADAPEQLSLYGPGFLAWADADPDLTAGRTQGSRCREPGSGPGRMRHRKQAHNRGPYQLGVGQGDKSRHPRLCELAPLHGHA